MTIADDLAKLQEQRDLMEITVKEITEARDSGIEIPPVWNLEVAELQLASLESQIVLLELRLKEEDTQRKAAVREEEQKYQASLIHRPRLGFLSFPWVAPYLGPLPEIKKFTWDDEEMRQAKPRRLLAATMMVIVVVVTLVLAKAVPGLGYNLVGLALGWDKFGFLAMNSPIVLLLVFMGWSFGYKKESPMALLGKDAVKKTQWLVVGSEDWTARQRLTSCMLYAWCHLVLIVLPFSTAVALGINGGLLIWTYLREHRRHGDVRKAAMATAKLHHTFNYYGLVTLTAVASTYAVWFVIELCIYVAS